MKGFLSYKEKVKSYLKKSFLISNFVRDPFYIS